MAPVTIMTTMETSQQSAAATTATTERLIVCWGGSSQLPGRNRRMEGQGAKKMDTFAIQASRYMGGNESLVGGWYTSTRPKNDGLRSSWDDFLNNSQLFLEK